MIRRADSAFRSFRDSIHQRDQHTCQYCGFQAREYQEIVNRDGNYRNNRKSNLITACLFCAQCFFLESIGRGEFGGGIVVHLPEMPQIQLNGLCHILFTSMMTADPLHTQAKDIYRGLRLRAQTVEQELGEGMSNPVSLGQLLVESGQENQTLFAKQLAPQLRILPHIERFEKQLGTWLHAGLKALV